MTHPGWYDTVVAIVSAIAGWIARHITYRRGLK